MIKSMNIKNIIFIIERKLFFFAILDPINLKIKNESPIANKNKIILNISLIVF